MRAKVYGGVTHEVYEGLCEDGRRATRPTSVRVRPRPSRECGAAQDPGLFGASRASATTLEMTDSATSAHADEWARRLPPRQTPPSRRRPSSPGEAAARRDPRLPHHLVRMSSRDPRVDLELLDHLIRPVPRSPEPVGESPRPPVLARRRFLPSGTLARKRDVRDSPRLVLSLRSRPAHLRGRRPVDRGERTSTGSHLVRVPAAPEGFRIRSCATGSRTPADECTVHP